MDNCSKRELKGKEIQYCNDTFDGVLRFMNQIFLILTLVKKKLKRSLPEQSSQRHGIYTAGNIQDTRISDYREKGG